MSLQQQPLFPAPPSSMVYQPSYASHNGRGSIGPVIAVLAVIAILGIFTGVVGRLCSGRRIVGLGQYDVEGWIERKCASCIDGHIDHPQPADADRRSSGDGGGGGLGSGAAPEVRHSPQDPPETAQH
ncbi:uncharacterized protein LOC110097199 [Dendrobium catenatum]|uniref:Transmembrane protein n=1 Tax=Dendrobium catenatum TaxID=906689 RepID=A0A2I0WFH7_9ASPA|nr:uncharacterized protein LOC110097199 [Dendrobium catenatum]PKU74416.1 hypothetical protein MA16_Dca003619 [Dendrobium catenatum]